MSWPTTLPNGHYDTEGEGVVFGKLGWPCLLVSLCLTLIGLLVFACFKKNRTFPVSILMWIAVLNIVECVVNVIRSAPNDLSTFYIKVTDGVCFFRVFFDMWFFYSLVFFNTAAALMLFLSVVKRIDVDNPRYTWGLWIGYVVFSIPVPFGLAALKGKISLVFAGFYACWEDVGIYAFIPLYICMFGQIVMVGLTIARVAKIISAVESTVARQDKKTQRDWRLCLLLLRFALTMMSQVLGVVGFTISSTTHSDVPASAYVYIIISTSLTPAFDAMVLILLNKPLLRWLRHKIRHYASNLTSGSVDSGATIALELKVSGLDGAQSV